MNMFLENGYLVIRNTLNQRDLKSLENYYLTLLNKKPSYFIYDDFQALNCPSKYGDFMADKLLNYFLVKLEELTKISLCPSNSYMRIYQKNTILEKHIDQKSREISATLTIGYDAPEIWSIFLEDKQSNVKEIKLNKGDMLIYRGIDLPHWRDKFFGNWWIQVFLHYVDKNGKFADLNVR